MRAFSRPTIKPKRASKYPNPMKNIIPILLLALSSVSFVQAIDHPTSDSAINDDIEIQCSLSGGMRQVTFEHYLLKFSEAVRKPSDSLVISASPESFVEIQKTTRLTNSQKKRLRDWITKYKIPTISIVPQPEKEPQGMVESRYADSLRIYINGREYKLNHVTIAANHQLNEAFDELFAMANEFTATVTK